MTSAPIRSPSAPSSTKCAKRFQLLRPTVNARSLAIALRRTAHRGGPDAAPGGAEPTEQCRRRVALSVECTATLHRPALVLTSGAAQRIHIAGSDAVEAPFDTLFANGGTEGMGIA